MSHTQSTRLERIRKRLEIKPHVWYSWKGYDIPEAMAILEELKRYDRKVDPIKAEARMVMAAEDLADSIPVSFAATLLRIPTPEFKAGTKFINGAEELPFKHHPRVGMYSWLRRPVARRDDIKELYYGEYGAARNLPVCSGDHHSGPGDQDLRSTGGEGGLVAG